MNPLLGLKLLAGLVIASLIFFAGWTTKGAFIAKRDLAIIEAKKEFIEVYQKAEFEKAQLLEAKLSELKANERLVIREIPKIINRDVYRNVCIDDDGLQLIERARTGQADTKQPVN